MNPYPINGWTLSLCVKELWLTEKQNDEIYSLCCDDPKKLGVFMTEKSFHQSK